MTAQEKPSSKQMQSIQFMNHAAFVNNHTRITILNNKPAREWNVVMIVLESVGYRYIFDTSQHNAMPMPFLHTLTTRAYG